MVNNNSCDNIVIISVEQYHRCVMALYIVRLKYFHCAFNFSKLAETANFAVLGEALTVYKKLH